METCPNCNGLCTAPYSYGQGGCHICRGEGCIESTKKEETVVSVENTKNFSMRKEKLISQETEDSKASDHNARHVSTKEQERENTNQQNAIDAEQY